MAAAAPKKNVTSTFMKTGCGIRTFGPTTGFTRTPQRRGRNTSMKGDSGCGMRVADGSGAERAS